MHTDRKQLKAIVRNIIKFDVKYERFVFHQMCNPFSLKCQQLSPSLSRCSLNKPQVARIDPCPYLSITI